MLKLKGVVDIEIVDAATNLIKERRHQENLIPDNTWVALLNWNGITNFFGGQKISISSSTTAPTASNFTLTNIFATGYVPSGVTSPTWNNGVDPPFGKIQNRIDYNGTSRIFNSVGLTNLSSSNQQNTSATVAAYLKLDLPCTQGETDYINIFYTIQFLDNASEGFLNRKLARYDFGATTFNSISSDGKGFRISRLKTNFCKLPAINYVSLAYLGTEVAGVYLNFGSPDTVTGWTTGVAVNSHFKWKYQLTRNINDDVGLIYNSMLQGIANDGSEAYTVNKLSYDKEPFQTGFWHSSTAPGPFFDPGYAGSSNGSIFLSGSWTGGFPELYKITITDSGATGSAKYKFSIMKHVGFSGNAYSNRDSYTHYMQSAKLPAAGIHGWRVEDFDKFSWVGTKIVQFDSTGVTLLNLLDGSFTSWDNTTTPALNVTTIRQIAADPANQKIYVACRSTGLWVIDVAGNTVANPLTAPCYGVDVGRNGVAIAITSGGFYRSTDWSTPVPIVYVGLTDGHWDRCKYLKADPEHLSDRLAVVADNGSAVNKIIWVQLSDNTTITGYQGSDLPSYPAGFDVSDIGSNWCYFRGGNYISRASFGSSTLTSQNYLQIYYSTINHSIYGNRDYAKISFYKDAAFGMFYLAGDTTNYTLPQPINSGLNGNFNITPYVINLDSGIVLSSLFLRQIFNGSSIAWTDYGWNGSNWMQGNTGTKTTHADAQALINGIQVRFQDGANSPQFTATDYFTQGVNYGLLKDNATDNITYNSQWYSKPIHTGNVNATIPNTAPYTITLPDASNINFRRVETDTPQVHNLNINSIPVINIYTSGQVPASGEISMVSSGNGVITFNSADAGKNFSGSYLWIEI